jgi:DNA-binding CsgD family transcriptional regulator
MLASDNADRDGRADDWSPEDWLPSVLESMGSASLAPALFSWLQTQVALEELFVFERPLDPLEAPCSILSQGLRPSVDERAAAYCADYYRLDPINPLLDRGDSGARAVTIASREIADQGYRSICYDQPDFAEKASFWRRGMSHWLVVSLFRSAEDGPFNGEDLAALERCSRLFFPLVAKHQALRRLDAPSHESRQALIARIEERIARLPTKLTPRQLEVCSRTAIGMTAEGVAIDLGVKTSSVVTHRRRAYERLGIATGFELTRLLL